MPQALLIDVAETMSRYGRVRLHAHPAHGLILESEEIPILEALPPQEVSAHYSAPASTITLLPYRPPSADA